MADYLVRARIRPERAAELREQLDTGSFDTIRPFGRGLAAALDRAHVDPQTGDAVWEVRCFCTPPLAAERPAILDRYFDDIRTTEVVPGEGWAQLDGLPRLW